MGIDPETADEQGIACLTYSYRGMENPTPRSMRASDARMRDWAICDGQAARDAARAAVPNTPLWVIGHSLGGMMVSKQPRLDGIARVITVASGLVSHREHPMPYRLQVWLFWFVLGPLAIRLTDCLHGRLSGLGTSLPAPVFREWRRWCTAGPNAFLSDDTLPPSDWTRCRAPVRIVSMQDDPVCPPAAAVRLARAYDGAQVETMTLRPADYGLSRLGHFDVFRRESRGVWPALIAE